MAIDIHSAKWLSKGGILYEFWLDSEDDVVNLAEAGKKAAHTSIAFIKSTGRILALGINGWEAI